MPPSDMNLRIGKIKNYNNKILISSPSFKIGTNLKINFDEERDKTDAKPKKEPDVESNKEHKQDVKIDLNNEKDKPDFMPKKEPNIKSNKEHKQDVKMMKTKPDTNKITYKEEKVALVLGITSIFTVWWMFK